MIKAICRMGNPILRKKVNEVSLEFLKSDDFSQKLTDMHDSMRHHGGIGIAAPQIGLDYQMAIIELNNFNRYEEEVNLPLTVFINPSIEYLSDEIQGFWEGCLSVPGLRGYVERPRKIKVSFMDIKGESKEIVAEGFLATVIQHELDHLNGVLYLDRVKDSTLLSYQEEFEQFIQDRTIE